MAAAHLIHALSTVHVQLEFNTKERTGERYKKYVMVQYNLSETDSEHSEIVIFIHSGLKIVL